jgi:hypothetical protein
MKSQNQEWKTVESIQLRNDGVLYQGIMMEMLRRQFSRYILKNELIKVAEGLFCGLRNITPLNILAWASGK